MKSTTTTNGQTKAVFGRRLHVNTCLVIKIHFKYATQTDKLALKMTTW